jgi:cytochrome c-type biogenesis protein CcmH
MLSDIDWRAGVYTLSGAKSLRQDMLPLPAATGRAPAGTDLPGCTCAGCPEVGVARLLCFRLCPFPRFAEARPVSIEKTPDVSTALRELLIARNAGKIGAEEFERRQAELHARLLAASPAAGNKERWRVILPAAVAAAVVLGGIGLYTWLASTPPAVTSTAETLPAPADGAGNAQAEQQVKLLTAEVTRNPMNGEAWAALARNDAVLDRHVQAAEAYAKAAAILPPDAALLSDWTDSYVMSHGRRWDETSRGLIKRALAADPKHLKTLSLAATEAFDQGDYKGAVIYWQRMKDAADFAIYTLHPFELDWTAPTVSADYPVVLTELLGPPG